MLKVISILSLLAAVAFGTFISDVTDCLNGYTQYTKSDCVADKIKIYSVAANANPEIKIGEVLNEASIQARLSTAFLNELLTALAKKQIAATSAALSARIKQNMIAGIP